MGSVEKEWLSGAVTTDRLAVLLLERSKEYLSCRNHKLQVLRLFQEAGEREARAQEHARISAEIERIMAACENEEAAMIRKAHNLLHQLGITLEDAEDVKRALQLALHDDCEHDIDDRKRHFTVLRRNFGTTHRF
ncbi:hypothetical protein YC2023_063205 [Brassica napus]